MKQVLVPTDFSQNAWNALEYAVSLFENVPCNFFVLHIADLKESAVAGNALPIPALLPKPKVNLLDDLLERIAQLPINGKHHFFAVQDYGNIIDVIRKTVVEKKIDMVVMGTKGADGIREAIVGSNTGDVITKVHCNILAIPENAHYKKIGEMVFPTDFNTFYTHKILDAISQMMQLGGSNLRVMNVSGNGGNLTPLQQKNRLYLGDYLEEAFSDAHSFHTITKGKVAQAVQLFVESRDIDMIIMVAKNLNFLQQLLFDSAVKKVSYHTTVPLLVIHE